MGRKKSNQKICSVPGCNHVYHAKGFCSGHYQQFWKFGRITRTRLAHDPNRFIVDGEVCKTELLNRSGGLNGYAIIDAEDYEKCKQIKWHNNGQNYARSKLNGKIIGLEHVVFGKKTLLDHKNRDPLDCRKDNLRECTLSENAMNIALRKSNKSGYTGVC